MKAELVNSWDEYDFERKEFLKTAYNKLGYIKFMKNENSAEFLIIDLYNRIHAITGDVIDWTGICYKEGSFNGIVYGKLGNVKVDSIYAGGYNIQRLHVRVLVKEI